MQSFECVVVCVGGAAGTERKVDVPFSVYHRVSKGGADRAAGTRLTEADPERIFGIIQCIAAVFADHEGQWIFNGVLKIGGEPYPELCEVCQGGYIHAIAHGFNDAPFACNIFHRLWHQYFAAVTGVDDEYQYWHQ